MNTCLNCDRELVKHQKKYCSSVCSARHTQRNGGNNKWSNTDREKLSETMKRLVKENPDRFITTKPKIKKICLNCSNEFYVCPSEQKQKCCNRKCYNEWISKSGYMIGKSGGLRHGSGRGIQGWYKGYYCNSSWELAWVIYQLEHNMKFIRNTEGFEYEFGGRKFKYYPDFLRDNGEYVEIKGQLDPKNKAKISQFCKKLTVLVKKDLKLIFEYVIQKYGKEYWKMYE